MLERKSAAAPIVVTSAMLVGVLALYVLSVGPAWWLVDNKFVSSDGAAWMWTLYAPITWLYERWPAFAQVMDSYVLLFA